jgi:hypothetical protein
VPALFEFKDQAWRYVKSGEEMYCGDVPKEAWKEWGVYCAFSPVVCRDTNDERRVTDMTGVGCPVALDIADRYQAATRAGQTQGSSKRWESGDWTCVVPSRPQDAFAPNCRRGTDNGGIVLGKF